MSYNDDEEKKYTEENSGENKSAPEIRDDGESGEKRESEENRQESDAGEKSANEGYADDNGYSGERRREEAEERRTYHGDVYDENGNIKRRKRSSDAYMSKKAVGWIVALCLVVSIVCGVCVNAVTTALNNRINAAETMGASGLSTTTTSSPLNPSETTRGDSITTLPEKVETVVPSVIYAKGTSTYKDYADVIEGCINSVVQINTTMNVNDSFTGYAYTASGAGAGVIFSKDGYIITNYHVVGADTLTVEVTLYDGSKYEGKYINGDKNADLAVIKINKDDCTPAVLGDSSQLRLGDKVVAIGNPLGIGIRPSEGIVSSKSTVVNVENITMTLMQTTAAINEGNSGGGLFNMNGELIGITNAKIGGTSVESMGYAIPSETVHKAINDFSDYGYITGMARLGVTAGTYSIRVNWNSYVNVVYIDGVSEKGSAALAGLQSGDLIYKIGDTSCESFDVLTRVLTSYKVGDSVELSIIRPTEPIKRSSSGYITLGTYTELTLTVTFVEFNPNL